MFQAKDILHKQNIRSPSNVRFTNNTNHSEDFERQFTATASYETVRSLNSVQEELVTQMVKDLTDQIFNATVANW